MSPSAEPRRRPARDAGFTVIEVMVAFVIFALVGTALVPALVSTIRANDLAVRTLQEKGFAQTQLELMRNLPFHVAPAAGDYIDVLDRHYPDLVVPSATITCDPSGRFRAPIPATEGYVGPGGARCAYEPDGAFYRIVRTQADDPALDGFTMVVDTQFLTDATPPVPVTPPTGYNARSVGNETPPTAQIGVTISVFNTERESTRPMTTYTQIARRDFLEPLIRSSVDISAIDTGTVLVNGAPITMSAGLINLNSSLTHASQARALMASTTTGISTGQQAAGASANEAAPPNVDLPYLSGSPGSLDASGCQLACWGATGRSALTMSAGNGLPNVGSTTLPAQVSINGPGGSSGLTLGANGQTLRPDMLLGNSGNLVRLVDTGRVRAGHSPTCATAETGAERQVVSGGWLRTTALDDSTTPALVEACGMSRSANIGLLPTSFAPQGIVRVRLEKASVACRVSGAAHTPTTSVDYEAVVEQWQFGASGNYVEIARVTEETANDALNDVPLTNALGGGFGTIGTWIESWSSLTADEVLESTADRTATAEVPGIITIVTQPVRGSGENNNDPTSTVSLSVGDLACMAQDQR